MSRSRRDSTEAPRRRESADPDEDNRPLPWFLVMFLGAMAMWGAFYIYSTPSGEDSSYGDQRTVASLRPPVKGENLAAVDGKQIYGAKCAVCHQESGLGVPGVFPPLSASEWVAGDEKILTNILLHGVEGEIVVKGVTYKGVMPAWDAMSDEELAAVMTYIRVDWGNSSPPIKPEIVKAQRKVTETRSGPYSGGQELKKGL